MANPESSTSEARFSSPSLASNIDGRFFQTLLENTSDGILTIDEHSEIVFANPAIEDILGYRPDELIGSSKLEVIPERLQHVHKRQLERYIETGEKNIDWGGVELPAVHKDGHEVPVSISFREHEYDGTRLFTGIFRDISERKQNEQVLREQNERLEEFASVLSHDLQNSVNIAQGYTELLAEDIDRDELDEIADAITRIQNLHDDMLTLTQEEKSLGTIESVALGKAVAEAWRWVDTGHATLVLEDEPITVEADKSRLSSLLENLLNNAVEHGGASVTVQVGPLADGDGFYVEDNGAGIPDEERKTVFEHGYTTSSDGTGLGLSIIKRIADGHGWQVRLRDSESGGARFEFHI
ncbi:PAS domain S-box protein [Natrinema versiforme]|uniref:histidine kinase n=1 Tax=Natrinema versiforme JCM 10478 TaxID=1227496 RepID=L9XMV6_9EURY|nr:PAS domain-containing sensor histidine kinase [Natrinema versiforme]ELY63119.1 PAS/PAC sensor signal transduction histidine kinase [Natrinema versiforme JCM 10478]